MKTAEDTAVKSVKDAYAKIMSAIAKRRDECLKEISRIVKEKTKKLKTQFKEISGFETELRNAQKNYDVMIKDKKLTENSRMSKVSSMVKGLMTHKCNVKSLKLITDPKIIFRSEIPDFGKTMEIFAVEDEV